MKRLRGFTLLELLVTIAIAAILSALAYPSFIEAIRKSRRADAMEFMAKVQQAAEQWRANNSAYTADMSPSGLKVASVASDAPSPKGYYKVSVEVPGGASASSYKITAKATGTQAADAKCAELSMTMAAGAMKYDSTSGEACWAK
jgi:type IV pilus assembly protein PilE